MSIKWLYYSEVSAETIDEAESFYKVRLPESYKKIVMKYNGGYPQPSCYDMDSEKEKVFLNLLSAKETDKNNLYNITSILRENGLNNIFAFGADPFGNYICFDYSDSNDSPAVVYYDHENAFEYDDYKPKFICKSFDELLNMLYEPEE